MNYCRLFKIPLTIEIKTVMLYITVLVVVIMRHLHLAKASHLTKTKTRQKNAINKIFYLAFNKNSSNIKTQKNVIK